MVSSQPMSTTRPLLKPDDTTARTGELISVTAGHWKCVNSAARMVVSSRVGNSGGTGSRIFRVFESMRRCLSPPPPLVQPPLPGSCGVHLLYATRSPLSTRSSTNPNCALNPSSAPRSANPRSHTLRPPFRFPTAGLLLLTLPPTRLHNALLHAS